MSAVSSAAVLIIGAGAAGLAAARALSRAGRSVVIIEGRNRVGGRVFTQRDPESPVPIELGAEFVHGKSLELCQGARAANLQLYEVSERHWYFENGKLSRSRDYWKKIESVMDQMRSSPVDQSLKQFLDSLPNDEETQRAKTMLARYVEGFHAANIEHAGIQGLVKAKEAADSIDGDKAFRFTDGYDSLMNALRAEAESYGARLRLNSVVSEIRWQADRVEANCRVTGDAGGPPASETLVGSAAIITLPLGVLQSNTVRFVPELPESYRAAIHSLSMGNVLKINLRFRARFWEQVKVWDEDARSVDFAEAGFFHCPGLPFPTWWTQVPVRAPVLVGWVGGPQAERVRASSMNGDCVDSSILDQAIYSLAQIFSLQLTEVRDQLEASYLHDWHDDPFARGAYSYVPVNGLAAQALLAQPVTDTLFFAGEALAVGHIGTVHGAMQSGELAARRLLTGAGPDQ